MVQALLTHTLNEPIKREGGDVLSVQLIKPRAGQLRGLKTFDLVQGDVKAIMTLLPRITEPALTPKEVGNLCTEDWGELAIMVTGFFFKKETFEAERTAMIEEAEIVEES